MIPTTFFDFQSYWWFYLAFIIFLIIVLVVDLGLLHKKNEEVKFKEALLMSTLWISLAALFAFGFYQYCLWKFTTQAEFTSLIGFDGVATAKRLTLEFLTGYVIEQSLSVDNLFVFVVVFSYFGIPAKFQHRVLFYGILGAIVFRGIFIAAGSFLMQFHAVIFVFGAFLIFTGAKMLLSKEEAEIDPNKNIAIKILKKFLPVTPQSHGEKFFVHINKIPHATPLFVCLAVLEATDVVFALDSVPAIFAITKEPLIVFTSNIFAILGLRSLYFLLAGLMDKFHYLKIGLAIVLMFVGLKMVWLDSYFDGKFPIGWSLAIILGVLSLSVVLSFVFPKKEQN